MARKRRGQRAKSEMNVVPYIDVMLVLLVIFMISAPLLNQSIEVNLPSSRTADEVSSLLKDGSVQPIVISVDSKGAYYIDRGDDDDIIVKLVDALNESDISSVQLIMSE